MKTCKFCDYAPGNNRAPLGFDQTCDSCWEVRVRLGRPDIDAKIILDQGSEYVSSLIKLLSRKDDPSTEEKLKAKIDSMDFEALLRHNRFGSVDDPIFQGETGKYFIKVMAQKKLIVGYEAAVAASKRIRWDV